MSSLRHWPNSATVTPHTLTWHDATAWRGALTVSDWSCQLRVLPERPGSVDHMSR